MQPASDKAQFSLMVNVVVEVGRVGSGRNEHHNQRIGLTALLIAFPYPCSNGFAVRWIAENTMTAPVLQQSVVRLREELTAFGILWCGAWIEVKVKFVVQFVEELLRRSPHIGGTAEHSAVQLAFSIFHKSL